MSTRIIKLNRGDSFEFPIEVLDKVFLAEPVDTYYKNRREHGVIVSMACSRPVETCF